VLNCANCGEENPDRARFCLACGTALSAAAPEWFRKTVTMLFSDVVGSTALGSRVDPEVVSHVMTTYYEAMKPVVDEHGGRMEKFIGDALVAVFGVPESHEDDALRACRTALAMRDRLQGVNADLKERRGLEIDTRTGIATGAVAGRGLPRDRNLVAGDTGNTAARLQGAAGPGEILIGEPTYNLVRQAVDAELLPPLDLKGKPEPVTAYRLLRVRPDAEALPRRHDATLVGRRQELESLSDALRLAGEERRCRLVTLVGEAGVGKSRLVRELTARVEGDATVVRGRCLSYGDGITYWPLAEIVRQATGIADDDTAAEAMAKLQPLAGDARVAEHLGGLMGLSDSQPPPGEIPHAVRSLVERLADRRPLVAVVDDIQWAEPALLELLQFLGERAAAPALLLCVARPELLEAHAEWPDVIRLHPLEAAESDELVRALLAEAGAPEAVVERITHAAGGNPLFCEQTIAMLIDEGRLARDNGSWEVRGDLSALAVPPSLHALLAARLDRLEHSERVLLGRASVAGEMFSGDAIGALVDDDTEEVLAALLDKDLLRQEPGEAENYAFRHLLIRDVAYETLTKEDRAALHERFADWLEETGASRGSEYDEIVGYHLEQAYRCRAELEQIDEHARSLAARACELILAAGQRAWRRGDVHASASLFTRSLALMDDDARRQWTLMDLAESRQLAGDLDGMDTAYRDAIEVATNAGDERFVQIVEISQLHKQVVTDPGPVDLDHVLAVGLDALERFERAGDDLGTARSARFVAAVHFEQGRLGDGAAALERAIAPSQRAGDVYVRYDFPNLIQAHTMGTTPISVALARGLELLELGDDRLTDAALRAEIGVLHAFSGDFDRARTLVQRAVAEFEDVGHKRDAAIYLQRMAATDSLAGDWPVVEQAYRKIYETALAIEDRLLIDAAAVALGDALSRLGRWEEAEHFATLGDEHAEPFWRSWRVQWLQLRARLHAQKGEFPEAERLARKAVRRVLETDALTDQADAFMDLAEVLEAAGRPAEAREAIERALETYERKEHVVGAERARAALAGS
jgi:class 3 adenylate cyclase/tetratricopeptide (TPR) repeat protein